MNANRHSELRLAEEAAEWLLRRMKDRSPECSAAFLRWLKASPKHIDEFLLAQTTFATLSDGQRAVKLDIEALLNEASLNVVPLDSTPSSATADVTSAARIKILSSRSKTALMGGTWLALAATVGLAAALGALWFYLRPGNMYETAIGEQRAFRLEDGSLLNLNTRSRIQVNFTQQARELKLLKGEALFTVARDAARPFRVFTDSAVVQALGTQFNVYARGDQTSVTVLEGRVRVAPQQANGTAAVAPALLNAGDQANVSNDGAIAKQAKSDLQAATAWQQRRLVFRAAPLAEVAEQFNRYNEYQVKIADDALGKRLIWGVFGVDEPRALVKFLTRDERVLVEEGSDGVVIRGR